MSGPDEGIYALRAGKDEGVGGMYATQGKFNTVIPVEAPGMFGGQTWKLVRVPEGDNLYYVETPQKYPPGVQLTGFHNLSAKDNDSITLGQPRKFVIEPTSDKDVYSIRLTGKPSPGAEAYVGTHESNVVTKVIPADEHPPSPPVWTFYPRTE